jgi:protein-disulfide isomerase
MKKHLKRLAQSKTMTKVVLPIVLVVILAIIGYMSFKKPAADQPVKGKSLNSENAKVAAETFINGYLMSGGGTATVKEITEVYGMYKLKVDIVSDVVDSYMTKDGKLFFPQAFDVDEMKNTPAGGTNAAATPTAPVDLPKTDKPVVELFVMSECPYGTQIEKGILPAIEALGKKIDFSLKFVDYAMHGEAELKEQMVQYCINKDQGDKFNSYLKCYLTAGKSADCLQSAGINTSKLDSCVTATDSKYKITENFKNKVGYKGTFPGFDIHKDDNTKYGVAGSPTLVINGKTAESGRDSASLLAAICAAFNNQPSECQASLSSETPAPGFGTGTTAGGAAASCN